MKKYKQKVVQCPYCKSRLFTYRHAEYEFKKEENESKRCKYIDRDIIQKQVLCCDKCGKEYTVISNNGKLDKIIK